MVEALLADSVPGPLKPGDTIAGKYVVSRLLGEGGMGQVVAAMHLDLEQEVAIKILVPERAAAPDAVERFLREARAASLLKSSHVAKVFDVGRTEQGLPYLVMELLAGKDLLDVLESGPLPPQEAVDAILQACDAVGEAHAHGIIHRDLKPENLFVTQARDGAACVKVLDFGISKFHGEQAPRSRRGRFVTEENTVLGSPSYMSPEQSKRSSAVDARSDIWSLGVTLYELLTNHDPFGAETPAEVLVKVLTHAPPSPTDLSPMIPAELSAVVMRCLEKEPAKRFPDVKSLVEALLPFGSGTTVPSWEGPPSGPHSLSTLARIATPMEFPPPSGTHHIMARTLDEPRSRKSPFGWIAAALGVLLVVGGVAAFVGLGRARSAAAEPPSSAASAPPPAPSHEASASEPAAASTPEPPADPTAVSSSQVEPTASASTKPAPSTSKKVAAPRVAPAKPAPAPRAGAKSGSKVDPNSLPRERTSW